MDKNHVLGAYKQLVRHGLRAVQNKAPGKHVYIKTLRERFRRPQEAPSPQAVDNTVTFITNAAQYGGMELKLLQNMIHVEYTRQKSKLTRKPGKRASSVDFFAYDETRQALNKTMNLAL